MTETIRTLLAIVMAGAAVTCLASLFTWWMNERRRLTRLLQKVLGGTPDAAIIAPGRNSAAGFRMENERLAVMRNGGARTLVYDLDELDGAELLVDDEVVARVSRNDGRKALDSARGGGHSVALRLIFANAVSPDFTLDLWLVEDATRRRDRGPAAAIQEGREWLGRVDALIRRPAKLAQVQARTAPDEEDPDDI